MSQHEITLGFPHPPAKGGGPGSFQSRLTQSLQQRGYRIVFPEDQETPDMVLVVGGTAKIRWLLQCKRKGAKIIHRLDGLNWIHQIQHTSWKDYARSEVRNALLRFTRKYLADFVVYQSEFVRTWWHQKYGAVQSPETIIYNGVDLSQFAPPQSFEDASHTLGARPNLLCVEGNVHDDPITIHTLTTIPQRLKADQSIHALQVCGRVYPEAQKHLEGVHGLELLGRIPKEKVPDVLAQDAIYVHLDANSACPNAVIEALAAGLPVVGFDTGALRELVLPHAGIVVPYGSNPWRMEVPDMDGLETAIRTILPKRQAYRQAAREAAEQRFSIEKMTESYIEIFQRLLIP